MNPERNKMIATLVNLVGLAIENWNLENGDNTDAVGLGDTTVDLSNGKEVFMVTKEGAVDFKGNLILYNHLHDEDIQNLIDAVSQEYELDVE